MDQYQFHNYPKKRREKKKRNDQTLCPSALIVFLPFLSFSTLDYTDRGFFRDLLQFSIASGPIGAVTTIEKVCSTN